MKIETLHPGVSFAEVSAKTGFAIPAAHGETFETTAAPTEEELYWIREKLDPRGIRRLESNAGGDALLRGLWAAEVDSDRRLADPRCRDAERHPRHPDPWPLTTSAARS